MLFEVNGFLSNRRTADVRSVGYSELFSLSREDVLAAMKDYPEAQEILQNLGRKRLLEAQRVARAFRQPASPGHDSSDNSTGKRIVDKLKVDVKGLKNVLRKSRRNTRPDESLELQPLTSRMAPLRRQHRIDDSQEITIISEPPISPLGAGLPLLSRLRLLKEKQDREEKRVLMEMPNQIVEQSSHQSSLDPQNQNLPLLQRILMLKSKSDNETLGVEREIVVKEPLLTKPILEETELEQKQSSGSDLSEVANDAATSADYGDSGGSGVSKKPWHLLKDASLTTKDMSPPHKSPPTRRIQLKQSLTHIRQQTKMYASVDDLSPEYCGLPFVKKLKILNERQKLAELEKAVRSSSLDCGELAEIGFDGNLTRSHSEACAIEYARKLAKLNKYRRSISSPDQLSPENETLERRNLKSILKKLSAESRTGSSEASATSTPDREKATAEFRRLMRAPTIEGYAARHSKLSKSVTFNKYTLQSPPSEESASNSPLTSQGHSHSQDQISLPPPNKIRFRPLGSGGLQMVSRQKEDDFLGELITGIKDVVQSRVVRTILFYLST